MTSPIPSLLPLSFIDLGHRARTQHSGIDELILDIFGDGETPGSGLIQPIVLVEKTPTLVADYEKEFSLALDPDRPYLLTAGGRRTTALIQHGCEFVYHGATSDPLRPGFILREETPLVEQLTLELKENLNREDMDWRDLVRSVVRAYRLALREKHERGEVLAMGTFGSMLGVPYHDMRTACQIYDHFVANPELYKNCTQLYQALSVRLSEEGKEVARLAVAKSLHRSPTLVVAPSKAPPGLAANPLPNLDRLLPGHSLLVESGAEVNTIPLSQMFIHGNGLDYMESQPPGFCDHIITDPDYAIELSVIDSAANNRVGLMAQGIRQASAEQSLKELYRFLPLAFRAIGPKGFLIFWYAIDHHEKLQRAATAAGFEVQAHPLIWHKIDFRGRSNGAPRQQWPKSTEFAMVCRKPGTILAAVQNNCVFSTDEEAVTKKLNHPFAKPFGLWKWLFKAVSVPGQVVFDPYVGSGSMPIAAIDLGLRPLGVELDESIYHDLILNLQAHYRSALGPTVKFK